VDIYDECLAESRSKGVHSDYVKADLRHLHFKPKSFDAVLLLDTIEHLEKKEGNTLIRRAESWATKKLIVSTPNGFLWEDAFDGNPYQVHKSGWTVDDFSRFGFKVRGCLGLKLLRGYGATIRFPPIRFWTLISHVTQKLAKFLPRLAFCLFCVKTKE
jgi:hypothetical protein